MNLNQINSDVTFLTGASTTVYTAADRLVNLNNWYHKVVTMILKAQDDWDFDDSNKTTYPILTANLVANQQDYVLPTGGLKVKRVEVSYDGTNWYKAEPFDVNERGQGTSTTQVASSFITTEPKFDLQANSVFLYPIPSANVTGGIKIWIAREVTEFTSSDVSTGTAEPGFDEPFHRMLSVGMALDWAIAKNLPNRSDLMALLKDFEERIKTYYGSKDEARQMIMKPAYVDY